MAEGKGEAENKGAAKQGEKDEGRLAKLIGELNAELGKGMGARPYLLVVATGYPVGSDGEMTRFAPQWAWRANVFVENEGGKEVIGFLCDQLKEVSDNPQHGVKKAYGLG